MSNPTSKSNADRNEWDQVADKAKDIVSSAGELISQTAAAIGGMAGAAACDVGRKADDATAGAGSAIQEFGERLKKDVPQTGLLGSASQAVASTVKVSGEYLESAKLSGMASDLAKVIRRNPLSAVLIAAGVGWILGRKRVI